MLAKFKQFVDEINAENGRNYKISVLEKYKDDEDIKYLLNFIYNPYITTGISDKKLSKKFEDFDKKLEDNYNQVIEDGIEKPAVKILLDYLQRHNTGTDTDIKQVQMFRYLYFSENAELFDRIVTKNIQLGIDVKTINKVIPRLIPEFNVQLANKYFDNPEVVEGKEFALTTKIDGGRIIAIKDQGKVSFYTRAGQKYEGLVDLEKEMLEKLPDNICLDGEITLLTPYKIEYDENNNPAIGTKLSSKEQYKETMKITRRDGEKHGVKMLVFDIMTANQFKSQKCDNTYYERRAYLNQVFKDNPYTYFECLPMLYYGTDTSEILKWLDYNISKGEEGVMINILDAPYEFKRSNSLLKVKRFQSCDLMVVGFEEGTNSNSNTLGALLLEYKGNIVKCGSGFSKDIRDLIWNNKDKYLNTIVEISYFEETSSATGAKSLRFPTFVDFRPDKFTPNY